MPTTTVRDFQGDLKTLPIKEIASRPRHSHHVDDLAFPGFGWLISTWLVFSWRAGVVTCRRRPCSSTMFQQNPDNTAAPESQHLPGCNLQNAVIDEETSKRTATSTCIMTIYCALA